MNNSLNDAEIEEEFDVTAYKAHLEEKYGQMTRGGFADLVEASPYSESFFSFMQIWDDNNDFDLSISEVNKYDRLRLADEVNKQIKLQASNMRATQEIILMVNIETKEQIEGLINQFMREFRANSELFNLSMDNFDQFTLHIMRFAIDKGEGIVGLLNSLYADNLIRPKASAAKISEFATIIRTNFRENAA